MTALEWTVWCGSVPVAAFAAVFTWVNLRRYRGVEGWQGTGAGNLPTGPASADHGPALSVCIPARNEEANIERCVRSVLGLAGTGGSSTGLSTEVLVYDDQSTDRTPAIVAGLCAADARIRSVPTRHLPAGWNGKQHACDVLGRAGRAPWLLFTDADVEFVHGGEAGVRLARLLAAAEARGVALLSTFPRQVTCTLGERLIVPMIHFVLFAYLPVGRMRRTLDPAASAGCGQFLLVRREAYIAAGGHAVFRASMHDGIMLPRAMRRAGFKTDLFDGSDLCSVRMYRGLRQTWRGFTKNAYEGLGNPALLVLLTLLHAVGHVLPWGVLVAALAGRAWPALVPDGSATAAAGLAVGCNVVQRAMLAARFGQPWVGVVLHPACVALMTLIQWHSFALHLLGRRVWKGRAA